MKRNCSMVTSSLVILILRFTWLGLTHDNRVCISDPVAFMFKR